MWVIRRVHISLGQRLDELLIVIDRGIDDTISDSLGDDLLRLLDTLQTKLGGDVSKRNLRVRDIDLLKTELDNGMLKSMDQTEHLISLEHPLVPCDQRVESLHVSLFDSMHDLVVRLEKLLEVLLVEDLAVRGLTHE